VIWHRPGQASAALARHVAGRCNRQPYSLCLLLGALTAAEHCPPCAGFFIPEVVMSNATIKASTLIVTVPNRLTKEQREWIVSQVKPNLPPDVGVLVFDGGITAQVVGRATLRRWNQKRRPLNTGRKGSQ
jgi:hypothetical protein